MSFGETAAHYGRKLVAKVYKPNADPGRAARVYREYDEQMGFERYGEICRARLTRGVSGERSDLLQTGIQYANVMSPDEAAVLLRDLTEDRSVASVKKGNQNLQGYRFDDHPARQAVVESLLTPEIDQLLIDFFESEYLVHWTLLSRNPVAADPGVVSFNWHCDKGPARHLKLLFYLNGSEEHGGNTELIDLEGSTRVAEKGYLFGRVAKRTSEISVLSKLAGTQLHSVLRPIGAGEAVIFPPATVLHRGVSPTRAPRYVLTLCLLPSPVPWKQAFERGVICDLAQQAKWPSHADELLRALDADR
jgi:hypothetical protein